MKTKNILRQIKPIMAVVAATTLAVSLSGCADSGSDASASGGDCAYTVGYSGYTQSISFYQGMDLGLRDGAKETGACVVSTNANGNAAQQLSDVQNLVSQGVNYLAINAFDGAAIVPGVKEAQAAGIPIIVIADKLPIPVDMNLGMGHVDAGKAEASALAIFLTAKYGSVKGKVVDVQGTPGTDTTSARDEGLQDLAKQYPDLQIVSTVNGQWSEQGALAAMSDVVQAHPDMDAIYTASGDMAAGAQRALEIGGLKYEIGNPKHIWVGGINGDGTAIEQIRSDYQDVEVSSNSIGMGKYVIEQIAANHDKGTKLPADYQFPSYVITPANIDSQATKDYGIWADEIAAASK